MGKTIYRSVLLLFISFWTIFILLDYWQHHPNYAQIIDLFQYTGLFITLGGIGLLSFFALFKLKIAEKLSFVKNGLGIFALCLFLILLSLFFYLGKTNTTNVLGEGSIFKYLGKIIITALEIFLIIWSAHSYGHLLHKRFFNWSKNGITPTMVHIASGIMVIVYLAFFAAFFHFLKWYVVLPILLLPLLLNYKEALNFLMNCTIKPINISSNFNLFGYFSLYCLLWLVSLNFVQILGPMPLGWDSLTLYANLPNLLHDYEGLVNGYQPYNWSLFMSLGLVAFGSTELMLSISWLGGILSLFMLYGIVTSYYKTNANFAFFALLIFYCIPSIGLQSFLELKVDLGLLFALLCVFALFLDWLNYENNTKTATAEQEKTKPEKLVYFTPKAQDNGKYTLGLDAHIIMMGLLSGFAFGIKFTTLFSFFALLAGIWFVLFDNKAFLGVFLAAFAAMLIVKLDDFSGLRGFHLSVDFVQWILFVGGVGLLAWTVRHNIPKAIRGIRMSFLYGFFFFIPFLPWATKNYMETKQLGIDALLNGKQESPSLNIRQLDKNLNK